MFQRYTPPTLKTVDEQLSPCPSAAMMRTRTWVKATRIYVLNSAKIGGFRSSQKCRNMGTWHSKHPGRVAVAGYPCHPISGLLQLICKRRGPRLFRGIKGRQGQGAKQEEGGQSGRAKRSTRGALKDVAKKYVKRAQKDGFVGLEWLAKDGLFANSCSTSSLNWAAIEVYGCIAEKTCTYYSYVHYRCCPRG